MTFVVDTREQLPYKLAEEQVTGTLPTGDYSVLGSELLVAVERKSKADAYRSVGSDRARFLREVVRMTHLHYAAIVVECSMRSFLEEPPAESGMDPQKALKTLLSWSVRFGVHVFFAGPRPYARSLTRYLLERWVAYHGDRRKCAPSCRAVPRGEKGK